MKRIESFLKTNPPPPGLQAFLCAGASKAGAHVDEVTAFWLRNVVAPAFVAWTKTKAGFPWLMAAHGFKGTRPGRWDVIRHGKPSNPRGSTVDNARVLLWARADPTNPKEDPNEDLIRYLREHLRKDPTVDLRHASKATPATRFTPETPPRIPEDAGVMVYGTWFPAPLVRLFENRVRAASDAHAQLVRGLASYCSSWARTPDSARWLAMGGPFPTPGRISLAMQIVKRGQAVSIRGYQEDERRVVLPPETIARSYREGDHRCESCGVKQPCVKERTVYDHRRGNIGEYLCSSCGQGSQTGGGSSCKGCDRNSNHPNPCFNWDRDIANGIVSIGGERFIEQEIPF